MMSDKSNAAPAFCNEMSRAVRVFGFSQKRSVADHGFAFFDRDELLGRRFVARKIERRKPMTRFFGLALRPDLRVSRDFSVFGFGVNEINAFFRRRRVFKAQRNQIAWRM
jgi:hypothetical protein